MHTDTRPPVCALTGIFDPPILLTPRICRQRNLSAQPGFQDVGLLPADLHKTLARGKKIKSLWQSLLQEDAQSLLAGVSTSEP